jgi:hypothetical protein
VVTQVLLDGLYIIPGLKGGHSKRVAQVMVILCDIREQAKDHITGYLKKRVALPV